MKTHDVAKALSTIARILRSLPNQELESFGDLVASTKSEPATNIGVSLSTLAVFSSYGKNDWERVISDFELPIEIRPRDAARDVMGKILTYLADNNDERVRIARKSSGAPEKASELSNALSFLLNNG